MSIQGEGPAPPVTVEGSAGRGRSSLMASLIGTMTATTFQIFVLSVLAVELIADFDLSRAELGLIGSANTLLGALSAPFTGRLTDRMGARRAAVTANLISSVGLMVMAVAPSVWVLVASALVLGIPQGWGNPATNALIAERVAAGDRGVVTGVKQSGVQFGIFLAGLSLPALAGWGGWRGAMWIYAVVFAIIAVAVALLLNEPPEHPVRDASDTAQPAGVDETARSAGVDETARSAGVDDTARSAGVDDTARSAGVDDTAIWRLAAYACCAGAVGGAAGRFFPLWAQETVGLSGQRAGVLVALGGLLGMATRIMAGRVAERRIPPPRLLSILAVVGAGYCVSLAATRMVGEWLLWPATVLNAIGIGAWNAVAMLAVIVAVPRERAGRASGIVMLGFLGGLSVGSPIAGLVVDATNTYQPVWWAGVVLLLFAATLPSRT